nr:hypothetical protein [Cupriavidus sp. UYPR2.512]
MAQAIAEAIGQEMERDSRVFVMGEDIGKYGGVFRTRIRNSSCGSMRPMALARRPSQGTSRGFDAAASCFRDSPAQTCQPAAALFGEPV